MGSLGFAVHKMRSLVILFVIVKAGTSLADRCCEEKTVGGVNYKKVGNQDTTKFGCLSNCVYESVLSPGTKYCFKEGDLPVNCKSLGLEECPEEVQEYILISSEKASGIIMFAQAVEKELADLGPPCNSDTVIAKLQEIGNLGEHIIKDSEPAKRACGISRSYCPLEVQEYILSSSEKASGIIMLV